MHPKLAPPKPLTGFSCEAYRTSERPQKEFPIFPVRTGSLADPHPEIGYGSIAGFPATADFSSFAGFLPTILCLAVKKNQPGLPVLLKKLLRKIERHHS